VTLVAATQTAADFDRQHYALLVTETEFDQIFGRVRDWNLPCWSEPRAAPVNQAGWHPVDVAGRAAVTLAVTVPACTARTCVTIPPKVALTQCNRINPYLT
jgi:hypothetical protein